MRRASLLFLILLALAVAVAPLAGFAEACADCLAGGEGGCSAPACARCLCCAPLPSVVPAAPAPRPDLAAGAPVRLAAVRFGPAPDPAGILHVPLSA